MQTQYENERILYLENQLQQERRKFKVGIKDIVIGVILWLTLSPIVWSLVVNSFFPSPIRVSLIALTNFTNDAVFGMQCKFRELK